MTCRDAPLRLGLAVLLVFHLFGLDVPRSSLHRKAALKVSHPAFLNSGDWSPLRGGGVPYR